MSFLKFHFVSDFLTPQEQKAVYVVAFILVGWGVKSFILKPTEPQPTRTEN